MSAFTNTIILDDGERLTLGFGLVSDIMDQFSPEEQERIRREEAREQEKLEREAELRLIDASPDLPAHMLPERHSPSAKIAEVAAAMDRADRREAAKAAQAHSAECGCSDCGWREPGARPHGAAKRLPSVVAAENKALDEAFLAQPATVGWVADVAADVSKLKHVVGKILRK